MKEILSLELYLFITVVAPILFVQFFVLIRWSKKDLSAMNDKVKEGNQSSFLKQKISFKHREVQYYKAINKKIVMLLIINITFKAFLLIDIKLLNDYTPYAWAFVNLILVAKLIFDFKRIYEDLA